MSETSDTRTSEKTEAIVSPQASKPSPWLAKSLLADSENDGLRALAIIGSNALTLAILFVAFRAVILRDDLWGQPLSEQLTIMSHGAFQDMIFASLLGGGGVLCAFILSPSTVARVFRWVCALFVLWGASNIMAMRLLSEPVTWAWVTYADVFNSTYAFDAIFHLINLRFGAALCAVLVAFFVVQHMTAALIFGAVAVRRRAVTAIAAPAIVWTTLISLIPNTDSISRGERLNPVYAMLQSLVAPPDWGTGLIDHGTLGTLPPPPDIAFSAPVPRPDTSNHPIQNVVLFVLESTPARFVEDYEGPFPITPNLTAYRDRALRIERVYAPTPASNYALFALTTGVVPEMKAVSPQQEHPDRDYLALGDVLDAEGFRTAFFASTDNRFDRREDYLPHAGFGTVKDYRDWSCDAGFFGTDGPGYHNTGLDRCTVGPVLSWIDAAPGKPFFLTFWTGQTHYPYFVEGTPREFTGNADQDRFLSAVAAIDHAFGLFMEGLAARDLLNETLVVVIGDHGEAFGEHGTYGHGSSVYEETLRVPFYMVNPKLFNGTTAPGVASTIDVAPTILDLVGIPRPSIWQGRSLFAPEHRDGTIFFSPWNGFQTGFVERHTKVIYNASTEKLELFDLANDPGERHDLAPKSPDRTARYRDKLADWLVWQAALSARYVNAERRRNDQAPSPERRISLFASGTYFETYPRARVMIDDEIVGVVQVSSAPNNAQQTVSQEQIGTALKQYFLENTANRCGRRLSVLFENDEWAGVDQTGDTNLVVKWIEVDGIYYMAKQFRLETEGAGSYWNDAYTMWKKGAFTVDLAPPTDCISSGLTAQGETKDINE